MAQEINLSRDLDLIDWISNPVTKIGIDNIKLLLRTYTIVSP